MSIYVAEALGTGMIKIGKADDIPSRLKELQTGCPVGLRLLYSWQGGYREERAIHFRFQDARFHGEWFFLDRIAADLAEIDGQRPGQVVAGDVRRHATIWGRLAAAARRAELWSARGSDCAKARHEGKT
jgi:hypothetical protein